jgi:hypothetical protein
LLVDLFGHRLAHQSRCNEGLIGHLKSEVTLYVVDLIALSVYQVEGNIEAYLYFILTAFGEGLVYIKLIVEIVFLHL